MTDAEYQSHDTGESSIEGQIGLDIGTANVVVAYNEDKNVKNLLQLNAFFTIPYSKVTKKTLQRDETLFFDKDEKHYIMGTAAERFASTFDSNTRRPVASGLLNPQEAESIEVIRAIINQLVGTPSRRNKKICFSVPGTPMGNAHSTVYHESIIRMHLESMGYDPLSINEGMAVVLSELSATNFTGIGISLGGGMCNVCFSYLSVPVVTYSIQKGGYYIDVMVGRSVGEPPTKIKMIKEEGLDLSVEPADRIAYGFHIYYDELFTTLVQSLRQVLGSSDNVPRLGTPVPLVLSGGTVMPRGSREKFKKALDGVSLPVSVSDIIVAENPLYATAKGALVMAITEETDT